MGLIEDKLRRDLALRGMRPNTIATYVRCCRRFVAHLRVGISNGRIESVSRDQVRFRTKKGKHATLAPEEFLRRFVMHVLPAGFVKIRHFGLLAPGNVHGRLEIARQRLVEAGAPPAPSKSQSHTPRSAIELLLALLGVDARACTKCLARARVRGPLSLPLASTEPRDTS